MTDFKKNLTIPNLLSLFRIVLVPVFAVLYLNRPEGDWGIAAGIVLILSGLTDLFDGYIARRFNQVTQLGKILDPIADKLTQATVVVCIAITHPQNRFLIPLVIIFIAKEALMGIGGLVLLRRRIRPTAALWFGKVATVVFYAVMIAIVFFVNMPDWLVTSLVALVAVFMIYALIRYGIIFFRSLKDPAAAQEAGESGESGSPEGTEAPEEPGTDI